MKGVLQLKRMILSVGAAMAAAMAGAAVETVSPNGGETVELLPSSQRRVMALATQDERIAALEAMDKAGEKGVWRRTHSLRLRWRTTAGEAGPWKVELWRDGGDGARETHWVDDGVEKLSDENGVSTYEWRVPRANLELGRAYCWKVTGGIKCDVWEHGSTVGGVCPTCGKNQAAGASDTARFVNAANPPRWIAVEGRVGNMRDLGGWRTTDGRRVRQGMIYRGQALNDNSVNGERRGRNRLMVEDVDYLKGTLGVKTELDLRSPREIADLAASPLGDGVTYIPRSSTHCGGIFADWGKSVMAANFRVFCDARNYPVYFHCIAGADRTGALAYVLNGVLGVSRHDLEVEWESTFYPRLPEMKNRNGWNVKRNFDEGFAKYGADGGTWQRRIELYLLDCGVTEAEIAAFKSIMLE